MPKEYYNEQHIDRDIEKTLEQIEQYQYEEATVICDNADEFRQYLK